MEASEGWEIVGPHSISAQNSFFGVGFAVREKGAQEQRGRIQLTFNKVEPEGARMQGPHSREAMKLGLKEGELYAKINRFYPHGVSTDAAAKEAGHQGHGVAAHVFRRTLNLARRFGAKAVFLNTQSPRLQEIAVRAGMKPQRETRLSYLGMRVKPRKNAREWRASRGYEEPLVRTGMVEPRRGKAKA